MLKLLKWWRSRGSLGGTFVLMAAIQAKFTRRKSFNNFVDRELVHLTGSNRCKRTEIYFHTVSTSRNTQRGSSEAVSLSRTVTISWLVGSSLIHRVWQGCYDFINNYAIYHVYTIIGRDNNRVGRKNPRFPLYFRWKRRISGSLSTLICPPCRRSLVYHNLIHVIRTNNRIVKL